MGIFDRPEAVFALNAVRQAAAVVSRVQVGMISPALSKDDRSPVTVADFASQAVVGRLLRESFPEDCMVAEEDSAVLRDLKNAATLEQVTHFVSAGMPDATSEQVCAWIDQGRGDSGTRFWTLDPIDGTKGFLRHEQYAIALALVVDGQVQLGVLGCPNLVDGYRPEVGGSGSVMFAARGQGAWSAPLQGPAEFTRLRVSDQNQPSQARILRSVERGHTNLDQVGQFALRFGVSVPPVSMDSQAKYAVLAAGHGEVYLRLLSAGKPNYREKIWDQAAGSIVIEEAGGYVTDLDGRPLDFTTGRSLVNNRGILATNRVLHPAALETLTALGA